MQQHGSRDQGETKPQEEPPTAGGGAPPQATRNSVVYVYCQQHLMDDMTEFVDGQRTSWKNEHGLRAIAIKWGAGDKTHHREGFAVSADEPGRQIIKAAMEEQLQLLAQCHSNQAEHLELIQTRTAQYEKWDSSLKQIQEIFFEKRRTRLVDTKLHELIKAKFPAWTIQDIKGSIALAQTRDILRVINGVAEILIELDVPQEDASAALLPSSQSGDTPSGLYIVVDPDACLALKIAGLEKLLQFNDVVIPAVLYGALDDINKNAQTSPETKNVLKDVSGWIAKQKSAHPRLHLQDRTADPDPATAGLDLSTQVVLCAVVYRGMAWHQQGRHCVICSDMSDTQKAKESSIEVFSVAKITAWNQVPKVQPGTRLQSASNMQMVVKATAKFVDTDRKARDASYQKGLVDAARKDLLAARAQLDLELPGWECRKNKSGTTTGKVDKASRTTGKPLECNTKNGATATRCISCGAMKE